MPYVAGGFTTTPSDSPPDRRSVVFPRPTRLARSLGRVLARRVSFQGERARYFDTTAFTGNAGPGKEGQFGNAGRNIITGTGDVVITLAVQKRFPMWAEGHTVELRGDLFDLLNRPNFGNPNGNLRSPAIGRITGAGGSRVVQVALRYDF